MYLEIVTPEATLYSGDVTSVALPGVDGEFQLLNNHAPIVATLGAGNVKIWGNLDLDKAVASKFIKEGAVTLLKINSGTIEMNNNKVIVLAD